MVELGLLPEAEMLPGETSTGAAKLGVGRLAGVSETLLMPLWAKAMESRRADPILRDPKAAEMAAAIDYDFDRFARLRVDATGYCIRAALVDGLVRDFLARHPAAAVVELGVGLDARFFRADNGRAAWFELDLPETIALRRLLLPEGPRRRFLAASVLDGGWLAEVAEARPQAVLFVAEGLFYFFTHGEILGLLQSLAGRFPGARLIFDVQSPLYLRYCRWRHPLRNSAPQWSMWNVRAMQRWDARFRVEREIGFGDRPDYDAFRGRLSRLVRAARRLCPPLRRMFVVAQLAMT
jgi:O-methyltransferase involved in polyketide biosynthesis